MDRTEFDLNNISLPSVPSISLPDDYDKDLQLAAEFGRYLLERNEELQNCIGLLQKEIEEKQMEMKLLETKVSSMREQLDEKCKQSDLLDATNYDLEQELAKQRRENLQNRKQIKELFDLCDKTRQQCYELEQEYNSFRSKQFASRLPSTPSINPPPPPPPRQRSHSFHLKPLSSMPSVPSLPLDLSPSSSMCKSHIQEFKARIHTLEGECLMLTDQLHRSEEEKQNLIERLNTLERQYRDEIDSLQNELNHCRKLLEKSSRHSFAQSNRSLFDEVRLNNEKHSSIYQPTDYHALFAPIYEKLKF